MRRFYSSPDKIRAGLAWVNETPDPNQCGCRNVRRREENGRKPGACTGTVCNEILDVPVQYYCARCVNMNGGAKPIGYMNMTSRQKVRSRDTERIASNR